jgi:hypothetical protein
MVFCAYPTALPGERSIVRQSLTRLAALLAGLCAVAALVPAPVAAQFTGLSRDTRNILEGHWQSCRESDGQYSERVYDHVVNGSRFEVHLGPRREFAIFAGVQDAHRDHESPDNLLKPYRLTPDGGRAKHRWEIPSLNLSFTVTLAGGSRTDCESWFIVLKPLEKTSH